MADQQSTWNDWIGATVIDRDSDKIGTLDQVYMDQGSGQAEWLAVTTGLFGSKQTFVPIGGAEASGRDLKVPVEKGHVKDAPNVDLDEGYLSTEDERLLYQHYGRDDYQEWDDSGQPGADTGTDVSGPETDDAMTRSEEELEVGTRSEEAGRVRLRKYVVTEDVTMTVPVRKEKVRVEREAITDENRDAATAGADISDEEHEMVLQEETPVVSTKTVPKERIRLDKDVEVVDQEVGGEVRKERVEVDDDTAG